MSLPKDFVPLCKQNGNGMKLSTDLYLWLLTEDEIKLLSDDVLLTSISKSTLTVAQWKASGDNDTRGGYLAYGVLDSQVLGGPAPAPAAPPAPKPTTDEKKS